ncbi:MAG: GAF domain-containing protein, partial [Acidobacteriota bacterium]
MADETNDPFDDAEAFDDLSEVRRALEAVERRQRTAARERRRLRAQLDGVLNALREDAIVLFFDADRELVEAEGPLQEQLGASAAELLADFEDFADEETFDALDEANKAVLEDEAAGACVSDGFLHGDDEDLAVTFIHLRRSDEDGELLGTEAIGLVAPAVESDEELDHDPDPFEMLLGQIGRRLIDDGSEASVERAAQNVGEFLLADRVVVNRYDEDARRFSMAESWLRSDTRPLAAEERGIPISEIPWAYSALGAGEHVVISEDSDLPADARNEKKLFASEGASSTLLVPMLRRDALIGFVSIQSTKGPRVWSDGDISRARNLVMLLAAALVRADVEEELDQAREDAEQAMARGEKAEARAVEAETLAEKASVALAAAGAEVKSLADKVSALESESERARDKERAAQEDAERAQRRSEDAAADALAVRQELEKMRDQLARTLHDDADLRAGSPAAAFTGPPAAPKINEEEDEADIVEDDEEDIFEVDLEEVDDAPAPWSSRPRGDDDLDPDAVFKMNIEDFGRSFDPDATLEMDAVREAAATSEDDDIADPGDAEESKDPLRTGGLDAMLEHTQASTEEGTPEKWKEEKASWEDSTGEVDLPEFLAERDEDDDEEDEDIVEFEIDGESDVDAARRVARDAAGRDEDDDESEERVGGLPPVILPDYMQRPGDSSAPGPD